MPRSPRPAGARGRRLGAGIRARAVRSSTVTAGMAPPFACDSLFPLLSRSSSSLCWPFPSSYRQDPVRRRRYRSQFLGLLDGQLRRWIRFETVVGNRKAASHRQPEGPVIEPLLGPPDGGQPVPEAGRHGVVGLPRRPTARADRSYRPARRLAMRSFAPPRLVSASRPSTRDRSAFSSARAWSSSTRSPNSIPNVRTARP